jgi:hypothetical protein
MSTDDKKVKGSSNKVGVEKRVNYLTKLKCDVECRRVKNIPKSQTDDKFVSNPAKPSRSI